jgi:hypothetical protein
VEGDIDSADLMDVFYAFGQVASIRLVPASRSALSLALCVSLSPSSPLTGAPLWSTLIARKRSMRRVSCRGV